MIFLGVKQGFNDIKMKHLPTKLLEKCLKSLLISNFFILNGEILTKMKRDFWIPRKYYFSDLEIAPFIILHTPGQFH